MVIDVDEILYWKIEEIVDVSCCFLLLLDVILLIGLVFGMHLSLFLVLSLYYFGMILLGFRYLASSIPLISLAGVGIGVGIIFAFLLLSISRNPVISNTLIRWSFIGFSLVEVSGFIGLVFAFLLLYAL